MHFLKENRRFLILCLVFALISVQRYCMAFVAFALILTLFWLPITLFKLWRRPAERVRRVARLGIWIGVCLLILAVHAIRMNLAQAQADRVAQALEVYHAQHANYPADLRALGLEPEQLRSQYDIHYWFRDGEPTLAYSSPSMFLFTNIYDFKLHRWQQLAY